jgi:hypothetical protein
MTRYLLAAVLAAGGTLAFAQPADAQYVYRYNTVNPWTGTQVQQGVVVTPFSTQQGVQYFNPWTGAQGQRYLYQNAWGTNVYRNSGFNPYYGGYNRGYSYPGFGASPLAGSWYNYRW